MEPSQQLIEVIRTFHDYLEEHLLNRINFLGLVKPSGYYSEETGELAKAMAKAHGEYPRLTANALNAYNKTDFAEWDFTFKKIRPILAANGLHFEQKTIFNKEDSSLMLHSRITHSSGQWSETRTRIIPAKGDNQAYSSEVNHKRRIQGELLLGITISGEDDDGETNMLEVRKTDAEGLAHNLGVTTKQAYQTLNAFQHGEINAALKGYPDLYQDILNSFNVQSLADLPAEKYELILKRTLKNVDIRKKGTIPVAK